MHKVARNKGSCNKVAEQLVESPIIFTKFIIKIQTKETATKLSKA